MHRSAVERDPEILEHYFLQICGFESSELSNTVLEALKETEQDEAAGGVPDYTKYHLAGSALLH
jgi:hypothetical protein